MFSTVEKPIGIFYGYEEWFNPLFLELERRGLPYVKLDPAQQWFDLSETDVPYSLLYNDMSYPSYGEGPPQANLNLQPYFKHLEQRRVPVINGSVAIALQQSKTQQLLLLRSLGLNFPTTRIVTHRQQLESATAGINFPIILKGNAGRGAETLRLKSIQDLKERWDDGTLALRDDRPWILQEWIPAKGNHVVRAEVINGNFQYAVKLYRTAHDIDFRAADNEAFEPSLTIVKAIEKIARAAHLEVASVEFAIDRRDNQPYFYAIHAHSNFIVGHRPGGYDAYAVLADHIESRLQKRREIELIL
jgi:glutathione synthase/RimK-type ligase-like ATP-grasp enzyme